MANSVKDLIESFSDDEVFEELELEETLQESNFSESIEYLQYEDDDKEKNVLDADNKNVDIVSERVVCPHCFNDYLNQHSLDNHIRHNHNSKVDKLVKGMYW